MIYDEITIENGFCTVNYHDRKHATDGSAKMLRNEPVEISLGILVFICFQVLEAAEKYFSQIYLFICIKLMEMYLNCVTFVQRI